MKIVSFTGARVVAPARVEQRIGVGLRVSRLAGCLPPRPALGAGDLVAWLGYLASPSARYRLHELYIPIRRAHLQV